MSVAHACRPGCHRGRGLNEWSWRVHCRSSCEQTLVWDRLGRQWRAKGGIKRQHCGAQGHELREFAEGHRCPPEAGVAHGKGQSGVHASNLRIEANCSQMSSLASVFNENHSRMCTLLHVWISVYSSMANRIDRLSPRNLYWLLDCHHRIKLLTAEFAKNIRRARGERRAPLRHICGSS